MNALTMDTIPMNTCNGRLRKLYQDIQSSLGTEEVKTIKELLSDEQLSKKKKEGLNGAAEIFVKLEEKGFIKANDLTLLHNILIELRREPLIEKYLKPCEDDLIEMQSKTQNDEPKTQTTPEVRRRGKEQHDQEQSARVDNSTQEMQTSIKGSGTRNKVCYMVLMFVLIFSFGACILYPSMDSLNTSETRTVTTDMQSRYKDKIGKMKDITDDQAVGLDGILTRASSLLRAVNFQATSHFISSDNQRTLDRRLTYVLIVATALIMMTSIGSLISCYLLGNTVHGVNALAFVLCCAVVLACIIGLNQTEYSPRNQHDIHKIVATKFHNLQRDLEHWIEVDLLHPPISITQLKEQLTKYKEAEQELKEQLILSEDWTFPYVHRILGSKYPGLKKPSPPS